MLQRSYLNVATVVFLLPSLSSCGRSDRSRRPTIEPQDPLWSSYISQHTTGSISKQDNISIVFANDVVEEERIGESAGSIVNVKPSIDGSITFVNAREIVVVPTEDLDPGQGYHVTVKRGELIGIPENLVRYEFLVNVIQQEFEIGVTGLSPDPGNELQMVLGGTLVTADIEDADRIERVVSAAFMNENLVVEWQHDSDGRHHEFTFLGIARQGTGQELQLSWDGSPIGVSSAEERTIEIPALNAFTITNVDAVQEDRQYVLVHFSDSLDARQNLRGLVTISSPGFTSSVQGNTLRILSRQPLVGRVTVTLEPGIRSARGNRLASRTEEVVTFASDKPRVRFVGRGVVLPNSEVLSVPIEAINANSVQVTAFRIYDTNVGQFLQTNKLDGDRELDRVGRYLWRRTMSLSALEANEWSRYSLDVTDLVQAHPDGMFRLILSINRSNSSYNCTEDENSVPVRFEPAIVSADDLNRRETSSWDYAETYYNVNNDNSTWRDRDNPCKDAYYRYADDVSDSRNFLASNIGILAKQDRQGNLLFATTDLQTAEPMSSVTITLMNFQDQPIGSVTTDGAGIGRIAADVTPFYALAERDGQRGYLKMSSGTVLPTSHFDVGGAAVAAGLKGDIYGERGVWRPGDDIHLTFVLEDQGVDLPDNHPVSMELFNPNGQRIQRMTNSTPVNGFYAFNMETTEDAPTGNWLARADVGGSSFTKPLKIETVIPNRLRVELDFGEEESLSGDVPLRGELFAQWLNGATASNLNADVRVSLTPRLTRFNRFEDYSFDDPAREFESEPHVLYDGNVDAQGRAVFQAELVPSGDAPGRLTANFVTRVFENGGAFSTSRQSFEFSPYSRYLGIKLPPGDAARGMLLTDTTHTVEIASLSRDGEPTSVSGIQISLYKVEWKWWWDRSGESLAQYASSSHRSIVDRGEVNTVDGRGTWQFQIDYPTWGRYLIRACDPRGRHCTGKIFYIDWPGWAGRAQEESGAGASVLTFFADKQEYTVGEIAQVQLPEATEGRALVTVENGTGILEQRWVEFSGGRTRFEIPISSEMSPNVYVGVTLIQPHAERNNDRPIRLYGVIPLLVSDPATRLNPVITAADEWRPETEVSVEVSEAEGRRMTYTLAVVDEGLLGLTNFQAPDLHDHFYQKEALGVRTWDLFDDVVGAYGGELERLLALGGGGEAEEGPTQDDRRRFPPVVRFLGPFTLQSGDKSTHQVTLPEYMGAVRVMIVAGNDGAYGSASKSVFVREPLSLLATVPRVIGPLEELTIPVSLFAMDETIERVTLRVETDDHFEAQGNGSTTVELAGAEEKLAFIQLDVGSRLGQGRLRFIATSGQHTAESEIYIDVRSANPATVTQLSHEIAPGETWSPNVTPHGLPGTNTVSLELTTLPPLNLERRLRYLIRYPHGCVEQVTSAVFPQLFLPSLVRLEPDAKEAIDKNVQAGIDRLRGFQVPTGGFVYWPGGFTNSSFDARNSWATNYVGHFLVEADKLGYYVPPDMMSDWINFQRRTAQSWVKGSASPAMDQAYRLYTLALVDRPEMGAMNRLRESGDLNSAARWQLAAAYHLAGLPDIASELVRDGRRGLQRYERPGSSFGSLLRDNAIVLASMVTMEMRTEAEAVVQEISDELASDDWHSTHAIAYALLAMSKHYGTGNAADGFEFGRKLGNRISETIAADAPIYTAVLEDFPDEGETVVINNTSDRTLYAGIVVRGIPSAGDEVATSSGLRVQVNYTDTDGRKVNVAILPQGGDFVAHVTVTNQTRLDLENLALEHMVPSGWEIHNPRLDGDVPGTQPTIEYQDIRDDRIYTYFSLRAGQSKDFAMLFNAAYLGRYYLPSVSVEAMYDATKRASTTGRWVSVATSSQ